MSNLGEEKTVSGVFGGVKLENAGETLENGNDFNTANFENVGTIRTNNLPAKPSVWNRFKSFWLQEIDWNKEIKIELTPHQQKIENEINEFLHQEITWEKVHDFLFQEVTFGRKKKEQL